MSRQALWDSLVLGYPAPVQQLTACMIRRRNKELRLAGSLQSVCTQLPACHVQAALGWASAMAPDALRSWQGCCWLHPLASSFQHPTLLVQSNDERFKAELGKVIEMEVWEQAKAESSKQLKATTSQKAATQTEQAVRQQHADTLEAQVGHCLSLFTCEAACV